MFQFHATKNANAAALETYAAMSAYLGTDRNINVLVCDNGITVDVFSARNYSAVQAAACKALGTVVDHWIDDETEGLYFEGANGVCVSVYRLTW